MLAETSPPERVTSLLADDAWFAQRKVDGHRYLVVVADGHVQVLNRAGQPKATTAWTDAFAPFTATETRWVFDGELVGGRLVLFDLPEAGGLVNPETPYGDRYAALETVVAAWQPDPTRITVLPLARTTAEKQALLTEAKENHWEGVMFRRAESRYVTSGRRSPDLLKHKFVRDVDVIVTALNFQGRDNAVLSLIDADEGKLIEVGRASTIGKGPVSVGDVFEVRFLYVLDESAPRLYQPRLMRLRTDKLREECLIDQLTGTGTCK